MTLYGSMSLKKNVGESDGEYLKTNMRNSIGKQDKKKKKTHMTISDAGTTGECQYFENLQVQKCWGQVLKGRAEL